MAKHSRALLVVATLAASLLAPHAAAAYNPAGAAAYADRFAHDHNDNYGWPGNDCANFVSQAMHEGGGYAMVRRYQTNEPRAWWARAEYAGPGTVYYTWSESWIRVKDLWTFLLSDSPGGYYYASRVGSSTASDSGGRLGDLLFYDWNGNGVSDHVAIIAVNGRDLVDAHTNNRYHAFWTLQEFNPDYRTTTIRVMRIDAAN